MKKIKNKLIFTFDYNMNKSLDIIIKQKINLIKTFDFIKEFIQSFRNYTSVINKLNKNLEGKKIRSPNFPSEISENLVKLGLFKNYRIAPNWNTKSGDLELFSKKLEIKAFLSNGPSSFGPNESWKKYILLIVENSSKIYLQFMR